MTSAARQESLEPTPGQQVAAARRTRGQNQEDLARALSAHMGIPWSRPGVSALENGEKTFTVAILKAVAAVQRFPYSWYLDGPYNEPPVAPQASGAIPRSINSGSIATVTRIEEARKVRKTHTRVGVGG